MSGTVGCTDIAQLAKITCLSTLTMKDNSCKQGINIDNQIDPKTITINTSADLFEIKDDAIII